MGVKVTFSLGDIEDIGSTKKRKRANFLVGQHIISYLSPYPRESAANLPPTPYYIRGRGTQTKGGNRDESQRLSIRWQLQNDLNSATVTNNATYSDYVVGLKQPDHMRKKGWKSLRVFLSSKPEIKKIESIYLSAFI